LKILGGISGDLNLTPKKKGAGEGGNRGSAEGPKGGPLKGGKGMAGSAGTGTSILVVR